MCQVNEDGEIVEKCEARKALEKLGFVKPSEGAVESDDIETKLKASIAAKLKNVPEPLRKAVEALIAKVEAEAEENGEEIGDVDVTTFSMDDPESMLKVAEMLREKAKGTGMENMVKQVDAHADAENERAASDPALMTRISESFTGWIGNEIMKLGLAGKSIRLIPGAVRVDPDVVRHVAYGEACVRLLQHVRGSENQRAPEVVKKGAGAAGSRDAVIRQAFAEMDAELYGDTDKDPVFDPMRAAEAGPVVSEHVTAKGKTLVIETVKRGQVIETFLRIK